MCLIACNCGRGHGVMFTRAGRGRVEVHVRNTFSDVQERVASVPATTSTTAAEVVQLVLEKCRRKEEPFCYQLSIISNDMSNRILADSECPLAIKSMWKSSNAKQNYFQLGQRKSGLLKVFYRAEGKNGTESFHSMIVTPSTSCQQLVKMISEKLRVSHQKYELVEKSSSGEAERIMDMTELPLITQLKWRPPSAYRFELHRSASHQLINDQVQISNTPKDINVGRDHIQPFNADSSRSQAPSSNIEDVDTDSSLQAARQLTTNQDSTAVVQYSDKECAAELIDRAELIACLKSYSSGVNSAATPVSREEILERALKEQNAVIDLLQQLNTSLEKQNETLEARVTEQSREVLEAEGHMLAAEQALKSKQGAQVDKGSISFAAMTGMEKILAQKDAMIANLQASLAGREGVTQSQGNALGVQISHLRSRVEQERLHCIELEEELAEKREEITNLNHLLSGEKSRLIKSQSQANLLSHELEIARKLNSQQKQLVFDLRSSLNDRNLQLSKLSSSLADERRKMPSVTTKNRSTQTDKSQDSPSSSPPLIKEKLSHLAMGLAPRVRAPLFEQLSGRQVITCELERRKDNPELGFSYSTVELPVSSISGSCLVIRAVKSESVASHFLQPGDEILEVNGFSCRSFFLSQAVDSLQQKTGNLKLVLARAESGKSAGLSTSFSSSSVVTSPVEVKFHSVENSSEYSSTAPSTVWLTAEDDTDTSCYNMDTLSLKTSSMVSSQVDKSATGDSYMSLDDAITGELEKLKLSLQQKDEVIDRLNNSLEDNEATVKHLSTNNNELQLHLDEINAAKDGLKAELATKTSFLTKAQTDLAQEKEINASQAQQLNQLQSEIEACRLTQVQMNDMIAAKDSTLLSMETENKQITEELESERSNMSQKEEAAVKLQQTYDSYKEETDKLIRNEREQKHKLEKQIIEGRIKNEELSLKVTSLNKELLELRIGMEQKESDLHERLQKVAMENQHLRADISSMQEASTTNSVTLQNISLELEELNKELSSKNAKLLEQTQLCDAVTKEKNQLTDSLGLTTAQFQRLQLNQDEFLSENEVLKKAQEQWKVDQLELQERCNSLDSKIAQLTRNEAQSLSSVRDAETRILTLQDEAKQLQDTINDCKADKTELETQSLQYKDQLSALESSKDAISEELKEATEKLNNTTEQLTTSVAALNQIRAKNRTLEDREANLGEQLDRLSSEYKSSEMKLSMKVRALEAQKAVVEKELERQHTLHQQGVNSELVSLRHETAQQREALMNNESEKIRLLAEIDQIKSSQKKMQMQLEVLESDKTLLEATNTLLKQNHTELSDKLSQSESACADYQSELKSTTSGNAELRASNTALHSKVKTLEEECSKLQGILQEHEQKLFEDQIQIGNISRQLEAAQLEASTKQNEHEKIFKVVVNEKKRSQQLDSSNKSLQEGVDKLSNERQEQSKKLVTLETMLQQEKDKTDRLENMLAHKKSEFITIEETWAAFKKDSTLKIQTLTTHNKALEENVDILKKQIESQQNESLLVTSELTKKCEQKSVSLKALQEELTTAKDECQKSQTSVVTLQHELQQVKETSKHLQESLSTQKIELANSHDLQKQTSSQLDILQKDHSILLEAHTELKDKAERMESELSGSTIAAESMASSVQELKIDISAKEKKCQSLEKQNSDLQEECQLLTDVSKKLEASNNSLSSELEAYQVANSQMKITTSKLTSDMEKLSSDLKASVEKEQISEGKIIQLENARKELTATIEALQTCQDEMKELLLQVERDKESMADNHAVQISLLKQQLQQKEKEQTEISEKLHTTERSKHELQSTVDQLIAAQAALSNTLTSTGNAKEVEIVKLQGRVADLESHLSTAKVELDASRETEAKLKHDISQLEREMLSNSMAADKLQASVSKATTDHETEVKKLQEQLRSFQIASGELETEIKKLKLENNSMNEEVAKLVNLKLQLAEKEEQTTLLNKELKENIAMVSALTVERDHLLTTLRRYEVNKHTEAIQQPTPKAARSSSKEELIRLLKDKEEEAFRLKDYISKLLASVVERAPFVLEQMK
ncbi:putative leucine-rich repeat-containing protein DDB_G0290503 isoform X2 [Dysidea avara]|uniref:putative leucine-rich repeat-containing protein DDB_G0290503 isoform X2 n=1 Tax=Dysidea avara TaxID=196820 RepID=UPI00332B29B9